MDHRTNFSQSDTLHGLVARKVVDARVRLSRVHVDQHLKIVRTELNRRVIRVTRLMPRGSRAFSRFRPMSIWTGRDGSRRRRLGEAEMGDQRDGAWSVGDQIVVAPTGQGLPESAGRAAPSARGPSILPSGLLDLSGNPTVVASTSPGGPVGVNVASFPSFFFNPRLPPIPGGDGIAQDDLGRVGAVPKSHRTKIASIVAVVSARGESRISDKPREAPVADAYTLHTSSPAIALARSSGHS